MKKAVFLDKDGTLTENVHYNADPSKVKLLPFAAEALKQLQDHEYILIIISNQSGVALGFFTEKNLEEVKETVSMLLLKDGIFLNDFYYCPHLPGGRIAAYSKSCECRKPAPGLLLNAARDHDIDLQQSWMIGDILDDVEAANRAGCKSILIDNGNETEWEAGEYRTPGFVVKDLKEAANVILNGKI